MREKFPPKHPQPALSRKKKAQETTVSLCGPFVGPQQLWGGTGLPRACAKQTDIWTTEGPGWGWAGLQGPPLSGGWNHSLVSFHCSSPPPAPSPLPIHSLRIYPAASLTQHVSGQISKKAPFNNDNNRNREKKSSTSMQSSLLSLPSPGFSQLMIDNVLLSLTPGRHMPFYWTTQPLWGDLGAQPPGPETPLGSFERGKKERPKSSLDGGWTNRYKAILELNVLSLCVWTRARQSRERVGSQGGVGTGRKGLSVPSCHPFLCPSRKGYYTETSKNQVYFEPVKITLPELSFSTLLASSEIPCVKISHFQSYFVTKRWNQQLLSIY